MLALYLGRLRHLSASARACGSSSELEAMPDGDRPGAGATSRRSSEVAEQLRHGAATSCTWAGSTFPGGPGRGAEAQGDQLHPRRGLPGRRDEARPDRPGRPRDAQRVPRPARVAVRQGDEQHRGGQGPRRPGHRRRRPRGTTSSPASADVFLPIPDVPEFLQPLVAVVPLQLLAYHIALLRGCDIDKPRNLAKSVPSSEPVSRRGGRLHPPVPLAEPPLERQQGGEDEEEGPVVPDPVLGLALRLGIRGAVERLEVVL